MIIFESSINDMENDSTASILDFSSAKDCDSIPIILSPRGVKKSISPLVECETINGEHAFILKIYDWEEIDFCSQN